jgi:hypothetical protein
LVACVLVFVREQTHRTFIGDDGVVQRVLGREVALRFDEVDAVYLNKKRVGEELAARALAEAMDRLAPKDDGGFNERTTNVTVTVLGGGKRIVLTSNTKGVGAFYREVVSRTKPRLLEHARRVIAAGEAVSFGPIAVKRDRLVARGKVLPLGEVETVDVDEGVVRVMSRTGWFTPSAAPVSSVPNLEVFKSLVRRSA